MTRRGGGIYDFLDRSYPRPEVTLRSVAVFRGRKPHSRLTMKSKSSLRFAFCAAVLCGGTFGSLRAEAISPSADTDARLLGQTYSAAEFGYTHHVESAPRALRRYGFVSSRPLVEAQNVDAAFRYNYTRGSAFGVSGHQHDLAMSFTGYLPLAQVKPFVRGDLGWAWTKVGGVKDDSFVYLVGVGVEVPLAPRLALTPFLNFEEARQFHDRVWSAGGRLSYRVNRGWGATFAVQADDEHNIEYTFGVLRRF